MTIVYKIISIHIQCIFEAIISQYNDMFHRRRLSIQAGVGQPSNVRE